MLAHPWLYGLMVAALFLGVRALAGAEHFGGPRDGLLFGVTLFAVGSLPVYALNFASFQVSASVIAVWAFQSLAQYVLAGGTLGWFCPRAG